MNASAPDVRLCLASNYLQLILMPTEACNFRCEYCYEDFQYKRMERWVVRGVKNLLTAKTPDLDVLVLSWFGGEPLLARSIIEDVLVHVQDLRRRHRTLKCTSDITTNAYLLTRPTFERLLQLGVTLFQITFDGPREWHDRRRVLANGRGTFTRIWNNLLALRDVRKHFQVTVRLHVDRDNYSALPRFVADFGKSFGGDARFKLFLRRLSHLGSPNDDTLRVFERDEAPRAIASLSRCAEEHRVEQLQLPAGSPICYAARGNSFLIRANGRLNKCTVALEHPINQVGRIHEDGQLELVPPKVMGWMRGVWSGRTDELECPMRGYADVAVSTTVTLRRSRAPRPDPSPAVTRTVRSPSAEVADHRPRG